MVKTIVPVQHTLRSNFRSKKVPDFAKLLVLKSSVCLLLSQPEPTKPCVVGEVSYALESVAGQERKSVHRCLFDASTKVSVAITHGFTSTIDLLMNEQARLYGRMFHKI